MCAPHYDWLIYIGRFQPFHNGHAQMVQHGLQQAKRLLLLLGSSNAPLSRKNPWSFSERCTIIESALPPVQFARLHIAPLDDKPDDELWKIQVQQTVAHYITPNESFALMGHYKDESSYYLRLFPEWAYVDFPSMGDISATPIRHAYFACPPHQRFTHPALAPLVIDYLNRFRHSATFAQLQSAP